MIRFQQNDRVVVNNWLKSKEYGTVKSIDEGVLIKKVEVRLDSGETKSYHQDDLSREELSQEQVRAEIDKVRSVVDKVAPKLSGEMGRELPNHLKFLAEYHESNDKNSAGKECKYVADKLETECKNGLVTKDWWENTRISFEKIYWAMTSRPL
jgi:hypothetical protein